MRLRIRILLLTAALLVGMTSTARACLPPILNPFCWLFGCGYGYGGYGYGGDYGYGYGYHANPYASYRVIDDWLGYGYLRNQEGTLGHYPGRPFGCYRPWFPGLFNPCPPPAPAFAMPGPMGAPLQMPTMHNPCWDPCQSQCADPCMPAPMVQCQPAPVPVTTWRPVTVDRGNWQMVWVPRPCTTMVPQTQYVAPPAMMNSGCGDNCFGDSGGMMPEAMPGMSSDSGCCGSNEMMQQQIPPNAVPQSRMIYPGQMGMSPQYTMSPYSAAQRRLPWRGTMAWTPNGPSVAGGYPVSAYHNHSTIPQMRPRMVRRETRQSAMPNYQFNGPVNQSTSPQLTQIPMGWPQQMAVPMATTTAPQMTISSDVMGDHEMVPATTAAIPIVPNTFSGPTPYMRANLSRPVHTMSANRYPHVVR